MGESQKYYAVRSQIQKYTYLLSNLYENPKMTIWLCIVPEGKSTVVQDQDQGFCVCVCVFSKSGMVRLGRD